MTWLGHGLLTGPPAVYLTHAVIRPAGLLIAVRAAGHRDQAG